MPSGKTHARASTVLAASITGSLAGTTILGVSPITPSQIAGVTVGLLIGIVITPDIDLAGTTHEERRIQRWFGKLAKHAWMLFWQQYAYGIRHRCPLSHAPIRSTLIRVAYLWPVWGLVFWLWPAAPWHLWPWILAGWIAQDTVHFILDTTPLGGLA